MINVLVTDSNSRKALCVVRSLGKSGYNVIAISDQFIDMSRASKYCSTFRKVTNPTSDPNKYLKELNETIEKYNIDVIIPMEDETVELVINNLNNFKNVSSLLPNHKAFSIARDKEKTMEYAKKYDVAHPKTYRYKNINDLKKLSEKIIYPVVIKPRISSGSRGMVYVENKEELLNNYNYIHKEYPAPMIQQFLKGDYLKIQVLAMADKESNIVASCTYQGIREFPVSGGPVTLWKTDRYPDIEKSAHKLLQKLKWTGFAEVEFMMNVQSKEYYLIEINPRFSANISLAVNVGIDFPLYYTRLALDQIVDVKFNTSANSYAQWLIPGDLLNFIFNKDRFRQKVGYFFNKPDDLTHAIFSKDDIKPFFANILSLFINFFSNIRDLLVKLKANKE